MAPHVMQPPPAPPVTSRLPPRPKSRAPTQAGTGTGQPRWCCAPPSAPPPATPCQASACLSLGGRWRWGEDGAGGERSERWRTRDATQPAVAVRNTGNVASCAVVVPAGICATHHCSSAGNWARPDGWSIPGLVALDRANRGMDSPRGTPGNDRWSQLKMLARVPLLPASIRMPNTVPAEGAGGWGACMVPTDSVAASKFARERFVSAVAHLRTRRTDHMPASPRTVAGYDAGAHRAPKTYP